MNRLSNKRQLFRQNIRKDFIQNLFETKRKQIMMSNQVQNESSEKYKDVDQTNLMLFDKSKLTNGLNTLIQNQGLLSSLKEKLDKHLGNEIDSDLGFHQQNIMFILTICSNCLLDDLSLHTKQYMVTQICLPITHYFTSQQKLKQIQQLLNHKYSTISSQQQADKSQPYQKSIQIKKKLKQIYVMLYFFTNLTYKKQQLEYESQQKFQQIIFKYVIIVLPIICRAIQFQQQLYQEEYSTYFQDTQPIMRNKQKNIVSQQYLAVLSKLDQLLAEQFSFQSKEYLQIFVQGHYELINIIFSHIQFFRKGKIVEVLHSLSFLRTKKLQLHRNRRVIQFLLNQLTSEGKINSNNNNIIYSSLSNLLIQQDAALLEKNNQSDFKKIINAFQHSFPTKEMYQLIGMMIKTPVADVYPYCQVLVQNIIELLSNWNIKNQQEVLDLLQVIQDMYDFNGFDNGVSEFASKGGKELLTNIYNSCQNNRITDKLGDIWDKGIDLR